MKITNWKLVLSICLLGMVFLQACDNKEKSAKQSEKKTDAQSTDGKSLYEPVNSWLNDFRNFRTAVYQKDVDKQKTYFSFPLNDSTQIWEAVYDRVDDQKRPEPFPATFTEEDFLKHHNTIFNSAFVKSLLKVKSEVLLKKSEYTTPELVDGKEHFSMVANFDKATSTLQLAVTYPGGTDDEGNYVSEGEYAIIYIFKITDNKYLKFDKVLFAG